MILRPSKIGAQINGIDEALRQNQINLGKRELGIEDAWHQVGSAGEPGFGGNWNNIGSPYGPLKFRKDTEGKVHMRGQIRPGAGGTPTSSTIFTLPADYRPTQPFAPAQPLLGRVTGGAATWYWYRLISITTSGDVIFPPGFDCLFLTMDNITFWTD